MDNVTHNIQDFHQTHHFGFSDVMTITSIFAALIGALQNWSGVFVSLSAISGLVFGTYRTIAFYKDRKRLDVERKKSEAKLKAVEDYAMTDIQRLSRHDMEKITADGKHQHTPKKKL